MERSPLISLLAISYVFNLASVGLSGSAPQNQTSSRPLKIEVVKVDARAIVKLAAGKHYSIDLTRKGVIYEIDPSAGIVDLTRVEVRTAGGEEPIESWLEKTFTSEALDKIELQTLRIGDTEDFRREWAMAGVPRGSPSVRATEPCGQILCVCSTNWSCVFMVASGKCGEKLICSKKNSMCVCRKKI